jgi:hypothetical protein
MSKGEFSHMGNEGRGVVSTLDWASLRKEDGARCS